MPNIDIQMFLVTMAAVLPSLTIHEFAHAFTAYKFGDNTAKDMGRLTLNPIAHIDLLGTIILPYFAHFGYAKPVPVNFSVLTRGQMLLVAIAGPISNLLLAIILALAYNVLPIGNLRNVQFILLLGIYLNIVFAVFNLIPIPPLDGSRVVYASIKNQQVLNVYRHFSQFGIFILIGLMLLSRTGRFDFFGRVINPVVGFFSNIFHVPVLFS